MRTLAVLAALALLASSALAGDEANPEITDDANDAGAGAAFGDIVAGWFNDTVTDISATMKLQQLAATPAGASWYFVADLGGATYGWGAFTGPDAQPAFFVSHWDRQNGPTDFVNGRGEVRSGGPGAPGYIIAQLPKSFAGNATAGLALTNIEAGTGQLTPVAFVPAPAPLPLPGQAFFRSDDVAQGKDYVLTSGPAGNTSGPTIQGGGPSGGAGGNATGNATAPPPPPARTPAPALPALIAVLAAAALLARRRR